MLKFIILFFSIFTLIQARSASQDEILIMVERMKKWVGGEEVVAGTNEAANETTPQPPAIAHPASTTAPAVSTPSTYFNMTTVNSSSETTPSTMKVVLDCTKFCKLKKGTNQYRKRLCQRFSRTDVCLFCRYIFFCGRNSNNYL